MLLLANATIYRSSCDGKNERETKGGDERITHKIHVTRVMDLPRIPIPSIHQNAIPRLRLDCLGILDGLPRQLRERLALYQGAALHLAEPVLLRVARIPDPVDEEVGGVEKGEGEGIPVVFRGGVVGQVDGAVAVREGHAGQIPEDQHEAPFLVVHVPDKISSQNRYPMLLARGNKRREVTHQEVTIHSSPLEQALA